MCNQQSEFKKKQVVPSLIKIQIQMVVGKLLKLKAEGREFAKSLRSLEQFIHTVKGHKIFW